MGRRGHVWYCRTRRQWRVTMNGKQKPLGPRGAPDTPEQRAAAVAAWESLTITSAAPTPAAAPAVPPNGFCLLTAADAAAAYLAWAEGRVRLGRMSAGCLANYRRAVKPFTAAFGGRPLAALAAEELEEWADRPGWSSSTQHDYLGVVAAVFKRAKCPITIRRPPQESRGAAVVLDADQFTAVLAALRTGRRDAGDMAAMLRALWASGARPGEMSGLEAGQVDWAAGVGLVDRHKTRRKTGKPRAIPFNTEALAVLAGQREKYGGGLLFRNRDGGRYSADVIRARLCRVSRRLGFRVCAYGLRHSFATRALAAGVPDAMVAAILGHRGTSMLHKHYAHLADNARAMRAAAELVSGKAG